MKAPKVRFSTILLGLAALFLFTGIAAGGGATVLGGLPATAQTRNFWTSGTPMPTAVQFPFTGLINGLIYVVGGCTNTAIAADNQIYNPLTNAWSTGAPMPVATCIGASAVVNNILYVFGGTSDMKTSTNAVWAYNPKTNDWSAKSPLPTATQSVGAAVENKIIFVVGGNSSGGNYRLTTVESYNPATNTWTEQAPLLVGKSEPSVGLLRMLVGTTVVSTIVTADGFTLSADTGDNEGYSASTNSWSSLTPDPNPRNEACTGAVGGKLFVAGGSLDGFTATTVNDVFKLSKNTWSNLAAIPQAVADPGSSVYKGLVYCFGGGTYATPWLGGNVFKYVQIYHP
jgi:N-acetylneuraminic acid mutarotase